MDVCVVGQTPNCRGESGCREMSTGRAHALTATSRSGEFTERGDGGGGYVGATVMPYAYKHSGKM